MCHPDGTKADANNNETMNNDSNNNAKKTSKETLEERIVLLRQVFQAVDFDTSLWDSLFGNDPVLALKVTATAAATAAAAAAKKKTRATTSTTSASTTSTSNTSSTTMTLAFVLTFLQLMDNNNNNNNNNVPDNYLMTAPAYRALEDFCVNHPHLHDSLLQCITMGLSNEMCTLYFAYIDNASQSVDDLQIRLDGAIQLVTQHNMDEMTMALTGGGVGGVGGVGTVSADSTTTSGDGGTLMQDDGGTMLMQDNQRRHEQQQQQQQTTAVLSNE